MATPVFMIGLDACDVELVQKWVDSGELKNFETLFDQHKLLRVTSSCEVYQGSVWPSFATGATPADHGMYYMLQPHETGGHIKRARAHHFKLEPFWSGLDELGKRVVIVDVPKIPLKPNRNGCQITEWGAMDHYSSFGTSPDQYRSYITEKYGQHPLTLNFEEPQSDAECARLEEALVNGIRSKGELNLDLIQRFDPELFVSVFGETHAGGHYLWHKPDSLKRIYRELDKAIGKICDQYADKATLIVFSGHGMTDDHYPRGILDSVLMKMGLLVKTTQAAAGPPAACAQGVGDAGREPSRRRFVPWIKDVANEYVLPRPLQEKLWIRNLQKDIVFSQTKAWSLPTDLQGFIRINLRNRDRHGIVDEVEYGRLCDEIADALHSLTDRETGNPIVDRVFLTRKLYPGAPHQDALPDISVLWKNKLVTQVASDLLGDLEVPPLGIKRTGNHRTSGFCIVSSPVARSSITETEIDLIDLAPTALELLDVELPSWIQGTAISGLR